MVELKDTAALMTSADYKERFNAEYHQLETRYIKLKEMCKKWDNNELNFTPTCPREWYNKQIYFMLGYLQVLLNRAEKEDVLMNVEVSVLKDIEKFVEVEKHNIVI